MVKNLKILGDKHTIVIFLNELSIKLLPTKFLTLYPQVNAAFISHQKSFAE